MEVIAVNAQCQVIQRYRIITCSEMLGDVYEVLLYTDGVVGMLGRSASHRPLCCSLLITELTPPFNTRRLHVQYGRYTFD